MKQFTYTHTHGNEGKLVEKLLPIEETLFDKLQYKKYLLTAIAYDTQGFTEADNGKEFREGEFDIIKKSDKVKCHCLCHHTIGMKHMVPCCNDGFIEVNTRTIATPKRSEERVFTLEEMLDCWDTCDKEHSDRSYHGLPDTIKEQYFKSKFSITIK